jgi:type IV pilus biogenesis protein CpaD/CtpE
MHVRASIASALVAATLCAGCQSTPEKEASAHREPVYRTGSNIPVRDPDAATRVITAKPDDAMPRTNMPDPRPGHPPIP